MATNQSDYLSDKRTTTTLSTMTKFYRLLVAATLCLGYAGANAQAPVDNAYQTFLDSRRLPRPVPHWTDSLPWGNVVNIQNYRSLVRDTLFNNGLVRKQNWLRAFYAAQDAAVAAGGGVVYFPALPPRREDGFEEQDSSYYFGDEMLVKSRIIVRGDNPAADSSDARNAKFNLPTYFEFPRFDFVSGNGRPGGTPNNTAFKFIRNFDGNTNNVAIVNVDINRAGIFFQPNFTPVNVGSTTTQWAVRGVYNILVLGVRNNNVAEPSPSVPSGNISSWHRWPYRFSANINLFVDRNGVVANCRINDYENNLNANRLIESDDFQQAGYLPNNTPGGAPLTGSQAVFRYNDHYGIVINRLKRPVLYQGVTGFVTQATEAQEPSLFSPGVEVHDSWVFKTQRVGIHVGGRGLVVARNTVADDSTKVTYCDATGVSYLNLNNAVPTYENRGIDFNGWDARVVDNDISVYRTNLQASNLRSADGEGFYSQAEGGVNPRNVQILRNTVRSSLVGLQNAVFGPTKKGVNGLTLVTEVLNITIKHNQLNGTPLELNAGAGSLSNVVIDSNYNAVLVTCIGNNGGLQSFVTNNTGFTGTLPLGQNIQRTITRNCHVSLNPDPTNATNTNPNLTPNTCTPITNAFACMTPAPAALMVEPRNDTTVATTLTTYRIYADFVNRNTAGACQFTNVVFYRDSAAIGQGTQSNFNPDRYYIDIPLSGTGSSNFYSARGELTDGFNSQLFFTAATKITQVVLGLDQVAAIGTIGVYPNPNSGQFNLKVSNGEEGFSYIVRDALGRQVVTGKTAGELTSLNLEGFSKGIYRVFVSNGKTQKVTTVAIQ